MGNPSSRRREGRIAFEAYLDPNEICPYTRGFMFEVSRRDWLEGWAEAERQQDNEDKYTLRMIRRIKELIPSAPSDGVMVKLEGIHYFVDDSEAERERDNALREIEDYKDLFQSQRDLLDMLRDNLSEAENEVESQHKAMIKVSRSFDKLYELTKHTLTLEQLSLINALEGNHD